MDVAELARMGAVLLCAAAFVLLLGPARRFLRRHSSDPVKRLLGEADARAWLDNWIAAMPLNPYLNYHRPCAQPEVCLDGKDRKRAHYNRYQTPLETLLELDHPTKYLRPGLSVNAPKRVATVRSDTDAAKLMQQAKAKLFEQMRFTA
jgi:hypothetical protein